MKRFHTLDDYVRTKRPGYWVAERFVIWRIDADLRGYWVQGYCSGADAEGLLDAIARDPLRLTACAVLADYRRLRQASPAAFGILARHVSRHARLPPQRREAVIRPGGPIGALVAGFSSVVRPFRPWRVFDSPTVALEWLERTDAAAPLREVEQSLSVGPEPSLVERVERVLSESPTCGLAGTAHKVGVSPRTLQRQLRCAGKTFRGERDRVLEAAARFQLANTTLPVSTVAGELGFASPAHFSEWFRRRAGVSPTVYRSDLA